MKVVLVGGNLNPASCLPGYTVERQHLWTRRREPFMGIGPEQDVFGPTEVSWIDYDLFIVDLSTLEHYDITFAKERFSEDVAARVRNGGVLIVFADAPRFEDIIPRPGEIAASNYTWLLSFLDVKPMGRAEGKEVVLGPDANFNRLADRFKEQMRWRCAFSFSGWTREGGPRKTGILLNKADEAVGIHAKVSKGHVFVLPQLIAKEVWLGEFVSNYLPTLGVEFDLTLAGETSPEWLSRFPTVEPASLATAIQEKRQHLAALQTEIDELELEKAKLLQYQEDLLWQTGDERLREAARWAFGLLGLNLSTVDPIDLVGEHRGRSILVEVTGSKGPIGVEKARQILDRVVGPTAPGKPVKGVLVGNPHRLAPPDRRPPKSQPLFTKEAEEIANGHRISLVLSSDLCKVVQARLRGEVASPEAVVDRIVVEKGLVRLSP